jgi:hypothetical protein
LAPRRRRRGRRADALGAPAGSPAAAARRGQPRFAAWRKAFAHAIECSTPSELEPGDMPSLLLLDAVGVQLIDREHWQGRVSDDRRWLVEQRESTDALLQRSESAWPVTVLGL